MTVGVPSTRAPRARRVVRGWVRGWDRVGAQAEFYLTTVRSIADAAFRYRIETLRLVAQMSLGTGALAVIGGTIAIVAFLTIFTGALPGVLGYNEFAHMGIEALTGFGSALFNVRLVAPLTAAWGMSATIGAGATAQLGAMRINEEIDALEVMGIRSIAYLSSTRVLAGVFVVIPLYCVAVLMSFLSARVVTTAMYGQSTGVYDHYFNTFLIPSNIIWSFALAMMMTVVIMLIHTYYGFTAAGGPAGVGEAVGRAVRTSLVSSSCVVVFGVVGPVRTDRQLPRVRVVEMKPVRRVRKVHTRADLAQNPKAQTWQSMLVPPN